jgi:rsbT antagonist protein RsbS
MNVPILKQGRVLICSFQDSLSDRELLELQQELARRVSVHRAKGVIIDITVLDVLDSFAVRTLTNLAHILTLRGAHTIIAGIQPEVAYSMVQLGLRLEGVHTALDLEDALDELSFLAIDRRGRS